MQQYYVDLRVVQMLCKAHSKKQSASGSVYSFQPITPPATPPFLPPPLAPSTPAPATSSCLALQEVTLKGVHWDQVMWGMPLLVVLQRLRKLVLIDNHLSNLHQVSL